ncbi:class I adenylate-forming enzyme family protein [Novosphingobium sp. 9U]|uniref:class I adenylate-forming enzyme family protein n=1 Tax=Novosphingobium sp. 9U TaxID=2653158 RepID=UPI0012F187CA|nr:AMP-binding protein [Novosphingobium sp. 9U]VWX54137.1 putative Long-chain-fatty-acid--CoA ligase [Novosphingobium sp. 9U]
MFNRATALFERAGDCSDKPAMIFTDRAITFAELAREVLLMAGMLARHGVREGSHVGILLPSSPQFVIVQQALFALGAAVTPLNTLYRAGEIAHAAQSCDLAFLITTAELAEPLDAVALHAAVILVGPDSGNDEPLAALADVDPAAPAMHLLTSATTGRAKGVALTGANLAANYDRTPAWLGLSQDDVILCALPLYNTFGLNQCINAMLVTGATMVLLDRFDAAACLAAIERHRCTFLPAVPTMLQKVFDHPDARTASLQSLRLIMTGGAPVPSALLKRILSAAPDVEVLTGYGLTEATALVTLTQVRLDADGEIERGRTIGRVLDGMELAIHDDTGLEVPAGQTGEIVVRGPNLMAGYYRSPVDTHEALRDGWLRTGDIGLIDPEGYAYIVDRKKDVIIRGGQNIYPIEIEEVLYQAPGVAEVAVVARGDAMLGEVPVGFVALADGCSTSAGALIAHCQEQLARFKVPAAIEILPQLPKGPTGKILRRALRDQFEGATA